MLRDNFQPRLAEFKQEIDEEGLDEVWFQQDGATAHTATRSMALVRELFPAHAISRRGDINWPSRSPDIAPCDFFLWGHLKAEIYKHRPKNLKELTSRNNSRNRSNSTGNDRASYAKFLFPPSSLYHQRRSSYARSGLSYINCKSYGMY